MAILLRVLLALLFLGSPLLVFPLIRGELGKRDVHANLKTEYLDIACSRVHFPITTKNPAVQKLFDLGVFQLHSFWNQDAARSFGRAALLDPDCAMAWWGLALANANHPERARQCIRAAVERKANASFREQAYIEALQFASESSAGQATEIVATHLRIAEKFPDDPEAWAVTAHMLHRHRDVLDRRTYRQIDGVLARILVKQPLHPAYHYRGPWQPWSAPGWILRDANDVCHRLEDYRGKRVVVIFYLGQGCLHCVAQLQAFAPLTERFSAAGVALVGISTENAEELAAAQETALDGGFPFPLLGNAELDVFKAYHAYDDARKTALHGTFVIDEEGLVRWQEISSQPFMYPEYLLGKLPELLRP